jgi:hypothetical protein
MGVLDLAGSAAPEAASPEDLPPTLFAALSRLGIWIYRDLRLLVKVIRVLKWALASQPQLQPQVNPTSFPIRYEERPMRISFLCEFRK